MTIPSPLKIIGSPAFLVNTTAAKACRTTSDRHPLTLPAMAAWEETRIFPDSLTGGCKLKYFSSI
jgi:hypothetical protein